MLFKIANVLDRLLGRPVFVGVYEDHWVFAGRRQRVLHDANTPQVRLAIQPDLELTNRNSVRRLCFVKGAQFVIRERRADVTGIGFDIA
jgi:hypothetical protein